MPPQSLGISGSKSASSRIELMGIDLPSFPLPTKERHILVYKPLQIPSPQNPTLTLYSSPKISPTSKTHSPSVIPRFPLPRKCPSPSFHGPDPYGTSPQMPSDLTATGIPRCDFFFFLSASLALFSFFFVVPPGDVVRFSLGRSWFHV